MELSSVRSQRPEATALSPQHTIALENEMHSSVAEPHRKNQGKETKPDSDTVPTKAGVHIPPSSLGIENLHFLATLAVGVVLWVGDVFDDYVVGLMLLMSWGVLGIVPSKLALSGFSHSSWSFVVAALRYFPTISY